LDALIVLLCFKANTLDAADAIAIFCGEKVLFAKEVLSRGSAFCNSPGAIIGDVFGILKILVLLDWFFCWSAWLLLPYVLFLRLFAAFGSSGFETAETGCELSYSLLFTRGAIVDGFDVIIGVGCAGAICNPGVTAGDVSRILLPGCRPNGRPR
jgi:hypothetical protein